jgi:hypothetical protein
MRDDHGDPIESGTITTTEIAAAMISLPLTGYR